MIKHQSNIMRKSTSTPCHRFVVVCLLSSLLFLKIKGIKGNILKPRTVVTWVNGIGFNMKHMCNGQTNISAIFGNRPVLFCHNPTAMVDEDDTRGWVGDLTQATTQKLGKITSEVDTLVR